MFKDINSDNAHNKNLNNIEASILNYENRLLADRKQLNDLIYECSNQNVSNSILNYKIKYLQTEIDYMNNQLNMLREGIQEQIKDIRPQSVKPQIQEPYIQPQNVQQQPQALNIQYQGAIPQPQVQNNQYQGVMPQMQAENIPYQNAMPQQQASNIQYQSAMPQPQAPYIQLQNKVNKPKDLENMIGKSWMGIFASVLIFISFILFATLLAPFITDTIKMIAMYVVSIMLTAFGLLKLRKNNNKLYLAISGCGVGAVYISLLLTNLYFKAIGDITLYIFILVWAVFVCYLSKWQDRIFQIIGQCGITIALFFGVVLCVEEFDYAMMFLLSLFFVVTASIFYVTNYSREFHKNVVNNVFNCINVFQIWVGAYSLRPAFSWAGWAEAPGYNRNWWAEYKVEAIAGIMLFFLILQFVLFLAAKLKEKNIGFGVFMIINTILMMLYISNMTYRSISWRGPDNIGIYNIGYCWDTIRGYIFIIIGVALLAVAEKKFDNRKDDGKVLIQCFTLPVFIISVSMIPFLLSHIGVSFVMILFILLGYYKDDCVYKYMSLLTAVIYCLSDLKYSVEYLCLGLLFFAILGVCMYVKKEQYNSIFKLLSYVAGFFFIIISLTYMFDDLNVSYDVDTTITLTVVSALNMFAMKSRFVKDFQTLQTEKHSVNVTRTINAILMVVSLYKVMVVDNEICHFILVLLAILIFMVNSKNLIEQYKTLWSGIYIGVKLTVLLITILCSYEAANYVISISAFLFAIISIVLGFRFYVKSFRLYGLFLSMLSVAKLILIDISYDNTLGHALSFFICGILCFVISMIYHLIDKRMQVK
ncbi:MAG: DUF2339 domain-containing protein [Lachnospiraceae bacterium]|nr:DUF2339 domain-containing protein [Lachnospiraceae bacterium]